MNISKVHAAIHEALSSLSSNKERAEVLRKALLVYETESDSSRTSAVETLESLQAHLRRFPGAVHQQDQILCIALHLKEQQGLNEFTAGQLNKSLKLLKIAPSNITNTIGILERRTPPPLKRVGQLAGLQQPRKVFTLTPDGMNYIERLKVPFSEPRKRISSLHQPRSFKARAKQRKKT